MFCNSPFEVTILLNFPETGLIYQNICKKGDANVNSGVGRFLKVSQNINI